MRSSQPSTDRAAASQHVDAAIVLEERAEAVAEPAANGKISINERALDGVSRLPEENEFIDATENEQGHWVDDAYPAFLLKKWEMDDPRDRWKHTGEPRPTTSSEGLRASTPKVPFDPTAPLTLVSPPAWTGVPLEPMRWLARNRIPAGDATILSGDGGGGKTTVALQLAVAVERGLEWLGATCESGPVIFFSGEEPEQEMRRRLARVADKCGIDQGTVERLHFHFADPDHCLLGVARPNNHFVSATPLFDALAAAVLCIRPALVVVDSIAAVFGGNQNDRTHARSFIGLFRKLALKANCAVLLLVS